MPARRQISRYESKATEVADKLFFNQTTHPKSSMRQAAKKFTQTPEFTTNCLYYDATFENGKWHFSPIGLGQHF